jgi:hypothetical protein
VKVVGIVPLITPIFALLLGSALNNETLTLTQLGGIVLVLQDFDHIPRVQRLLEVIDKKLGK